MHQSIGRVCLFNVLSIIFRLTHLVSAINGVNEMHWIAIYFECVQVESIRLGCSLFSIMTDTNRFFCLYFSLSGIFSISKPKSSRIVWLAGQKVLVALNSYHRLKYINVKYFMRKTHDTRNFSITLESGYIRWACSLQRCKHCAQRKI